MIHQHNEHLNKRFIRTLEINIPGVEIVRDHLGRAIYGASSKNIVPVNQSLQSSEYDSDEHDNSGIFFSPSRVNTDINPRFDNSADLNNDLSELDGGPSLADEQDAHSIFYRKGS